MKAFKLKYQFDTTEGTTFHAGSIVLVDDNESEAFEASIDCEEVPDGTPISIPASRTEPV